MIFRQRPVANTPAKASFRSDGSPSDSRPEVDRRPPAGVTVEQVNKAYVTPAGLRVTALREVSFAAAPSEMIALMAPSGSGKSTLLHVVGAMDTVDSGTILVGQHTVTALHGRALVAYRRSVGFVFQRFHLLSALTALDNVLAPLLPYRPSGADRNRARELLDRVGLGERLDARPAQLSGGEQQRVAIARSLVNQPQLLLADEPTGNLDSAAGAAILDLVTELHSESGMTVLIATHDPAVAARCDRIIQLRDGRVVVDQEA